MTEDRAAGKRQEDRLGSGLDSKGIIEEVKKIKEIDSTHRVYRMEWLFDRRFRTAEEAEARVAKVWAGRLREEDVEVREDSVSDDVELWVRRWNVESEWKSEDRAETHAAGFAGDVEIVARNSRREHQLTAYGILKLTVA